MGKNDGLVSIGQGLFSAIGKSEEKMVSVGLRNHKVRASNATS